MQALNTLVVVHASFEQAGANLEVENCDGGQCAGCFGGVKPSLTGQEHMSGELKDSQENLECAFAEFKEANRNLDDACERTTETTEGRCPRPHQNSQG